MYPKLPFLLTKNAIFCFYFNYFQNNTADNCYYFVIMSYNHNNKGMSAHVHAHSCARPCTCTHAHIITIELVLMDKGMHKIINFSINNVL